jgi:long-chain acyl-CoA synthetase
MSTAPVSLPEAVIAHAARHPDRAALICGGTHLSYAELARRQQRLAAALAGRGIGAGAHVALAIDDKIDFIAALLATLSLGAVAVPLDVRESQPRNWILADSAAVLLLHDRAAMPADCPSGIGLLPADADAPPADIAMPVEPGQVAAILYTSGTQNVRKGVSLSHGNLMESAAYMNAFMGIDASIIESVSSPLDHAFGFGRIRAVLLAGGTAVMDNGTFNAARVLAGIERHACTAFSGVAASVAVLIEHGGAMLESIAGRLRWMEVGSQSLLTEHRNRLRDLFPGAILVQNFGMTEAVRCTMLDFAADLGHLKSCGRPSPGTALRIVDEDGSELAPRQPGIIEVRGPQVALTYWGRDELWRERCRDGWFQSDDFGYVDEDGYLYYLSRRDDLINIAGEKVSPLDIEDVLRPLMGGRPFAVCAMNDPDRLRGEVPAVCLARADLAEFNWPDIRKRLAGHLPNKHWPKAVFTLDALPRTTIGKVQRKRLRQAIEAGEASKC